MISIARTQREPYLPHAAWRKVKRCAIIDINALDLAPSGGTVPCLNSQVHGDPSRKHRLILTSPICQECHDANAPSKP